MVKIVCFITKATSSLDYLIPLVSLNKGSQEFNFTFVFWDSKNSVIKNQQFYYDSLNSVKVKDLDDLFKENLSPFKRLLWKLKIYRYLNRDESQDIKKLANQYINQVKPDLIIFDHREVKKFALNSLKLSILESKIPTILIPHAPHHTGTEAFVPFTKDLLLPCNFQYWMAFKYDNYAGNFTPKQKLQFKYIGYPGLDSQYLKTFNVPDVTIAKKMQDNQTVKVVLLLRKIFPESVTEQPKNHDNYAFFYKEFYELLSKTYEALSLVLPNFELHLKPHPATKISLLEEIILKTKKSNIKIDNDSIFAQLGKFDIFLSFYTTTILIPMAFKKPSLIIDSRIQNEIRHWIPLKNLYDDSPSFLWKPEDLTEKIRNFSNEADLQKFIDKCYAHLRNYYPDNAGEIALREIKDFLNAKK